MTCFMAGTHHLPGEFEKPPPCYYYPVKNLTGQTDSRLAGSSTKGDTFVVVKKEPMSAGFCPSHAVNQQVSLLLTY